MFGLESVHMVQQGCVFERIMDAEFHTQILRRYIVLFVQANFADGTHRFMQDNDLKHKSISPALLKTSLKQIVSTGGRLLLSHPI